MRKLLSIVKWGIALFYFGWVNYYFGKTVKDFITVKRLKHELIDEIEMLKVRRAVHETRIALLQTPWGRKLFIKSIEKRIYKKYWQKSK